MERFFFVIGAFLAGLAVAAGAFGAHGLEEILLPEMIDTWEIAARYQIYHGLALMALAWAISNWWNSANTLKAGGWFFILGIILFSGSLYFLAINGELAYNGISLGLLTPLGGIFFVMGWLALTIGAWRG
jgi:uncharacterized membrane protein YgdD (TMEM256/DUF423 family)